MLDRDRAYAKARKAGSAGPVPREHGLAQPLPHVPIAVNPNPNRDIADPVGRPSSTTCEEGNAGRLEKAEAADSSSLPSKKAGTSRVVTASPWAVNQAEVGSWSPSQTTIASCRSALGTTRSVGSSLGGVWRSAWATAPSTVWAPRGQTRGAGSGPTATGRIGTAAAPRSRMKIHPRTEALSRTPARSSKATHACTAGSESGRRRRPLGESCARHAGEISWAPTVTMIRS